LSYVLPPSPVRVSAEPREGAGKLVCALTLGGAVSYGEATVAPPRSPAGIRRISEDDGEKMPEARALCRDMQRLRTANWSLRGGASTHSGEQTRPLVGPDTRVITLQNGVRQRRAARTHSGQRCHDRRGDLCRHHDRAAGRDAPHRHDRPSISRDGSNRGIARALSAGCAIGESAGPSSRNPMCPTPCEAVDAILQGVPPIDVFDMPTTFAACPRV
jgi:hypothetical protein